MSLSSNVSACEDLRTMVGGAAAHINKWVGVMPVRAAIWCTHNANINLEVQYNIDLQLYLLLCCFSVFLSLMGFPLFSSLHLRSHL